MSNAKNKKLVFVGMSGGVDSSVAAVLLKKRGYEVVGVHLKCYNVDGCAEQDAEDARRAAEFLGIPFYVLDMEQEYKDKVVEYMIDGYKKGLTPNPDVMCNKEIKFGLFLQKALEMGADYVATGHYVRLSANSESITNKRKNKIRKFVNSNYIRYSLMSAKDGNKDQSYFLWTLTQEQLKHCLFPIGDYAKPEVRRLAKKFGLPNAEKKDSQGICFLGQVTLKDFLSNYIPQKRGRVLNSAGEVVGEHSGAYFYTIGQRRIGVNLRPTTNDQRPFYVASKDVKTNTVTIATEDDPILYKNEIEMRDMNFIDPKFNPGKSGATVFVRVRYRQPLFRANLIKGKKWKLIFDQAQKFIASGQSAVFYAKDGTMLGGGVIA